MKIEDTVLLHFEDESEEAARLARAAGLDAALIERHRFPDDELRLRLPAALPARVVLYRSLHRPNEKLLELLLVARSAGKMGAQHLTLVAPYLAYMRQDKRFHDGESVTSRSFARLVSSTFDKLLTVDPHLHRYPTLSAVYTIPTITLHAAPLLANWISNHVEDPLIVGPDEESEQWAGAIASRIGVPHAVLRKTRHGDRSVSCSLDVPYVGDHSLGTG